MGWSEFIAFIERHLLPCGIKALTGFDCPGCGMQRAFVALLRGDLQGSIGHHPALLFYLAAVAFAALHLRFSFRFGPRVIAVLFIAAAALMIVNFIVRLRPPGYL